MREPPADAVSMIQPHVGAVAAFAATMEQHREASGFDYGIPRGVARVAMEAREGITVARDGDPEWLHAEYDLARALMSAVAALALLGDHEDAHIGSDGGCGVGIGHPAGAEARESLAQLVAFIRERYGDTPEEEEDEAA